jgi:hypothetical protein
MACFFLSEGRSPTKFLPSLIGADWRIKISFSDVTSTNFLIHGQESSALRPIEQKS